MNTYSIWFHGTLKSILELNEDLKKFPEDTINNKKLDAQLTYIEGYRKGSAFLHPISIEKEKGLTVKNWEDNFKNFQADLGNKTIKFEYNEKIYHIYADEETYKKRWQCDFEEMIIDSKR